MGAQARASPSPEYRWSARKCQCAFRHRYGNSKHPEGERESRILRAWDQISKLTKAYKYDFGKPGFAEGCVSLMGVAGENIEVGQDEEKREDDGYDEKKDVHYY